MGREGEGFFVLVCHSQLWAEHQNGVWHSKVYWKQMWLLGGFWEGFLPSWLQARLSPSRSPPWTGGGRKGKAK